jgi:glycosyltransferase involved in cell wall biosynthesis
MQDSISFAGKVSQQEVLQALQISDIYLFPSLKEGGTWSLMEAMAVGLSVICINTTGMQLITTDDCAVRIPPTNRNEIQQKMTKAILRLSDSGDLRHQMGTRGRKRIEECFSWSSKGAFMVKLLNQLDDQTRYGG